LMVLIAGLFISYQSRRKYLEGLLVLTENLKERYLLSEVMEKPDRAEDAVFYRILKLSHKSMLEKVAETAQEQKEYKEYIEQWVHEAKAPVTAMKLLCENQNTEDKRALLSELERMNHYIEQTLFSREVSTQRRII
ncbi:MAG: sensor histidine kinase, partial [Lachnospiraceae bacterium]|nr:sensor histidine kinase [Lachnospiraceae bacterium]